MGLIGSPAEIAATNPPDPLQADEARHRKARRVVKHVNTLDRVVIRFAGDSGDGDNSQAIDSPRPVQCSATTFSQRCLTSPPRSGHPPARCPECPALPAALRQLRHHDPGDRPDVLVAMNPGALKANIADLPRGGVINADSADFSKRNLAKVGYAKDRSPMARSTTTSCTLST